MTDSPDSSQFPEKLLIDFVTHSAPCVVQRLHSATAVGNSRSAAKVADKLSEPPECPAGRRFAVVRWLARANLQTFLIYHQPAMRAGAYLVVSRLASPHRPTA